jgi:hypothetical protein
VKSSKKKEIITEHDALMSATEFLTREYQDNPKFITVEHWRECGEWGLWLCVSELIDDIPEEFMDFDLDQKVIDNG